MTDYRGYFKLFTFFALIYLPKPKEFVNIAVIVRTEPINQQATNSNNASPEDAIMPAEKIVVTKIATTKRTAPPKNPINTAVLIISINSFRMRILS